MKNVKTSYNLSAYQAEEHKNPAISKRNVFCWIFNMTFPSLVAPIAALLFSASSSAVTYNAAIDFSHTDNPNGVWSYGWEDEIGFHLFTEKSEIAPNVYFWTGGDGPLGEPTAGKNEGSSIIGVSPTMFYEPGEFALHPGSSGQKAVLRWTSPHSGSYSIRAMFTGVDSLGTTTDVYLHFNGTDLVSGIIDGSGSVSYAGKVDVDAGETLDFLVGFGENLTFWSDTTRVDALISTVPEAADTGALFGLAVLVLWFAQKQFATNISVNVGGASPIDVVSQPGLKRAG